uniref:Uncharacterized protein n=1 Tax=Globodera rostochiensis TaxID=31243 RepID=A0A914H5M1_GLORO
MLQKLLEKQFTVAPEAMNQLFQRDVSNVLHYLSVSFNQHILYIFNHGAKFNNSIENPPDHLYSRPDHFDSRPDHLTLPT